MKKTTNKRIQKIEVADRKILIRGDRNSQALKDAMGQIIRTIAIEDYQVLKVVKSSKSSEMGLVLVTLSHVVRNYEASEQFAKNTIRTVIRMAA